MSGLSSVTKAVAAALAELTNPTQDATATVPTKAGGSFSYSYVTLAAVLDHVRPTLAKHELALAQRISGQAGEVGVETVLVHAEGEWSGGTLTLRVPDDPQRVGSAITYARRYGLLAALGLTADEDDDGAAAKGAISREDAAAVEDTHRVKRAEPGEPFCPGCFLAYGGAKIAVRHFTSGNGPSWRCQAPAEQCGGSRDSKGKTYSWAGWHDHYGTSVEDWGEKEGVAADAIASVLVEWEATRDPDEDDYGEGYYG